VDALVLSDSGGFRLIGTQSWAHWLEWWTLKWTQNSDFSALRSSQTALPERHVGSPLLKLCRHLMGYIWIGIGNLGSVHP